MIRLTSHYCSLIEHPRKETKIQSKSCDKSESFKNHEDIPKTRQKYMTRRKVQCTDTEDIKQGCKAQNSKQEFNGGNEMRQAPSTMNFVKSGRNVTYSNTPMPFENEGIDTMVAGKCLNSSPVPTSKRKRKEEIKIDSDGTDSPDKNDFPGEKCNFKNTLSK